MGLLQVPPCNCDLPCRAPLGCRPLLPVRGSALVPGSWRCRSASTMPACRPVRAQMRIYRVYVHLCVY